MSDLTLTFDKFRISLRNGLKSGEADVHVTPKALSLLWFLVERPGRVFSKDELFSAIWPETAVSDAALATCIQELRTALGDDARRPRFIETVHRRGYRFLGETRRIDTPLAIPLRPSIAVLPFLNLSDSSEYGHFADGITDDLITDLARVRWLFVIARNSSFCFKGKSYDVKDVARTLGVRYVLEGTIRKTDSDLRVSAQLIDGLTGATHWASRYDREIGNIFKLQEEITQSVVAAIEPNVLAAEGDRASRRPASDLSVWELVAQAQAYFWRLTRADYGHATDLLRRAVDLSPDYAPARALFGFCQVFAVHMGWITRQDGLGPARQHAVRSIMLDDRNPWGHIALGYCAMMERQTEESIAAFRRAVDLNPSSAAAHSYLSHGLGFAGKYAEAIFHGEEAIRLSPLDPEMARFLGGIAVSHFTAGHYEKAVQFTTDALRLRPEFQGAQRLLCASLAQCGRITEAQRYLALVKQRQPQISAEWVRLNVPYQTPELIERFVEGMRKAGMQ